MLDVIMPSFRLNLSYAEKLLTDIPDEQMCAQPLADRSINHPAFIIGHISWALDSGLRVLGGEPIGPVNERERFGMGAKPTNVRADYPAKAALWQMLADVHAALEARIQSTPAEALCAPAPERMRDRFPSVAQLLTFLMTTHEAVHLGQLSTWRRAMGLPSVL